jgi:hypothetical protein
VPRLKAKKVVMAKTKTSGYIRIGSGAVEVGVPPERTERDTEDCICRFDTSVPRDNAELYPYPRDRSHIQS